MPYISLKLFLNISILYTILYLIYCQDDICIEKSSCMCKLKDGSIIDLTSIGNRNGTARFKVSDGNKTYVYYYNPCYGISEDSSDKTCINVAGCQVSTDGKHFSLGTQSSASFFMNGTQLAVKYSSSAPRTLMVQLVCGESLDDELTFIGENPQTFYNFTLQSRCACPNKCLAAEEDKLSTGSLLVILLFIFILCYIFGGIIFQKIIRGATGRELFPNYEFWMDFPLLVRDGVIFTCNGCQNEVSYERI